MTLLSNIKDFCVKKQDGGKPILPETDFVKSEAERELKLPTNVGGIEANNSAAQHFGVQDVRDTDFCSGTTEIEAQYRQKVRECENLRRDLEKAKGELEKAKKLELSFPDLMMWIQKFLVAYKKGPETTELLSNELKASLENIGLTLSENFNDSSVKFSRIHDERVKQLTLELPAVVRNGETVCDGILLIPQEDFIGKSQLS